MTSATRDTRKDHALIAALAITDTPNYLHGRIRFAALVLHESDQRGITRAEAFRRLHAACMGHAPIATYQAFRHVLVRHRNRVERTHVVNAEIDAIYDAASRISADPVASAIGVYARSERGMIESEQSIDAEESRAMARRLDAAITSDKSRRAYWTFLEHYARLLAR